MMFDFRLSPRSYGSDGARLVAVFQLTETTGVFAETRMPGLLPLNHLVKQSCVPSYVKRQLISGLAFWAPRRPIWLLLEATC